MKIFSVHISFLISHIATAMLLLRVKIWPRKSYSNLTQLIIFILLKIGESEIFVHESPEIWCKIRQRIPHDTKYSAKKRLNFCETAGFGRNCFQNVTLFVASCTKTEGNAPSFLRGWWHDKPPKHTPFDALLSLFLNEKSGAFESFCGFCALKTSRHVKNYYFCSALRRLPLVEQGNL